MMLCSRILICVIMISETSMSSKVLERRIHFADHIDQDEHRSRSLHKTVVHQEAPAAYPSTISMHKQDLGKGRSSHPNISIVRRLILN